MKSERNLSAAQIVLRNESLRIVFFVRLLILPKKFEHFALRSDAYFIDCKLSEAHCGRMVRLLHLAQKILR